MIGRCHHVTLRLKILFILFIVVIFYSITWLFNFRIVSHRAKTMLDSPDEILKIAVNHTFGHTNRNTSENFRPIYPNNSSISKQTNARNVEIVGNKILQTDNNHKLGQVRDIGTKRMTNGRYLDDNTNMHDKKITNLFRMNETRVLLEISKSESNKKDLDKGDKAASNKFTSQRNNVQNGRMDEGMAQKREQPKLMQLSLSYKPNSVTKSAKQIPVILQYHNKNETAKILRFESLKKVNSNNTVHKELSHRESSHYLDLNASKSKWIDYPHLNDTFVLGNKLELDIKNETNSTMDASSEQILEQKTFASCKYPLDRLKNIKVGILIPSSTRKITSPSLINLTLIKTSLPSIYDTLEEIYVYRIYIGIDEGDFLQTVQDEIQRMFDCVIPVIVNGNNFVKSVNTIADRAYRDGMDYLVRTNDDTVFVTRKWTSLGINKLREYHPENIGVVGPTCKEGNTAILTHDMVHRRHLEIFDFYYPPYLENWWSDDWITHVYEPKKSTKLTSWVVKHVMLGTRYTVDFDRQKWVDTLIKYDKNRLHRYIGCNCEYCESSAYNSWKHLSKLSLLPCFFLLIQYICNN